MRKLNIKQQFILFLSLFTLFLSHQENNYFILIQSLLTISAALFTEWIFLKLKHKKINLESATISGLIIGCVLSIYSAIWIFPLCGIMTIILKHLFRWKSKHIFNPAALGILFITLFFNSSTEWKGAYSYFILISFGGYFVYRFNRWRIALAYFLTSVVLFGGQALIDKTGFIDATAYLNYFFIFIMLIEPKTTPSTTKQKIIFGICVSLINFILYLFPLSVDAVIPSLLICNFIFFSFNTFKKGASK